MTTAEVLSMCPAGAVAGIEVRMGGKVGRGFGYKEYGVEKADERQREEENEVSVHGWTPQDQKTILHAIQCWRNPTAGADYRL